MNGYVLYQGKKFLVEILGTLNICVNKKISRQKLKLPAVLPRSSKYGLLIDKYIDPAL